MSTSSRSGLAAVSGASGFIGSAVVRRLLKEGRRVRALVEPGANLVNLDGLESIGEIERVTVDVCDQEGMTRALEGADAFYHLAAIYKIWAPDPRSLFRVNVEGTTASLLAAQRAEVSRVVYTSSIAAVGKGDRAKPYDETADWDLYPIANEYILTKWMSERVALEFAKSGMHLVVVNPAFPFGARDIGPTPTGNFIVSLLNGDVPGIGEGGFCAVDVDDVAEAHVAAETQGRPGERYILGNHNVTFREFFDLVGRRAGVKVPKLAIPGLAGLAVGAGMEAWSALTGREPLITYRGVRYTQNFAFFDASKARRELNLKTTPLEETIDKAVRFFRESGMAKGA